MKPKCAYCGSRVQVWVREKGDKEGVCFNHQLEYHVGAFEPKRYEPSRKVSLALSVLPTRRYNKVRPMA